MKDKLKQAEIRIRYNLNRPYLEVPIEAMPLLIADTEFNMDNPEEREYLITKLSSLAEVKRIPIHVPGVTDTLHQVSYQDGGYLYAVDESGAVVIVSQYEELRLPEFSPVEEALEISNLWIDPVLRGSVGRRLFTAILSEFRSVVSDGAQTALGRAFLMERIRESLSRRVLVYLIDEKKCLPCSSKDDLKRLTPVAWGNTEAHRDRRWLFVKE
jgi:hypothetical protein